MVKGNHHQHMCCPPLFHNFQQVSVQAAISHPININKEVDELLAKGATAQSTGGADFFLRCLFGF